LQVRTTHVFGHVLQHAQAVQRRALVRRGLLQFGR
jgi:hypothetical protein